MKRRDEWGFLTYPFWNTLLSLLPMHWLYRRCQPVYFFIEIKAYGESTRWDMAHR